FVTAMMAFFLLLWLLNAVTEEQLQGIADYFAPTTASVSASGAGGMLGGQTVGQGAMSSQGTTPSFSLSLPPPTIGQGGDALSEPKEGAEEGAGAGEGGATAAAADSKSDAAKAMTEEQVVKSNAAREQKQFDRAQEALKQAVNGIPELKKMADSMMVDNTPEGLRIQIVDQEGLAMFPKGSPDMYGHTKAMLDLIGRVVKQLPERIAISGHTDATPFAGQSNYGNWELSADRALATRRALVAAGVPGDRVDRVVGRAEVDPLSKANPGDPRNRRITIVLLRDSKPPPTVNVTPAQAKGTQIPEELRAGGQMPAAAKPAGSTMPLPVEPSSGAEPAKPGPAKPAH
ncbi:MAG TPA: OmpA family protein, partial [Rhodospirillaceae bacterium]|nr:OmpA family protein [Rhodospirillaceae bacterium]